MGRVKNTAARPFRERNRMASRNLYVNMIAKTAAFDRGMRKSRRELDAFQRTIGGFRRSLQSMATVAVGAVGMYGLGALVKREMQTIDATAKLAKRIGETTERLVGLQHGAEITGSSANQLGAAIEVLQKRIGEAQQGTGEARGAFEALGLSLDEVARASPYQQMLLISRELQNVQDQTRKAAIVSDLFSRANAEILGLLDEGPAK